MTQIDFYTNVTDKLNTACRITAKAHGQGLRVMLFCPDEETARQMDRALWINPPLGFVPHCFPGDALAAVTPVIVDHAGGDPPHDEVLLNLRQEWPPFFSRFQRLVEIVSLDDADRQEARGRYKFYRDRGYEIRTHDMSKATQ